LRKTALQAAASVACSDYFTDMRHPVRQNDCHFGGAGRKRPRAIRTRRKNFTRKSATVPCGTHFLAGILTESPSLA
jgi:hypothetical protein